MFRRLGRLCAGTCAPFAGSAQVEARRRPEEQDRARPPAPALAEGPRDRTSSLVNAVLCYTLLEVLQRLGLPLLAFGRCWALLACVLFWLWHSIEPSRPPKKWNPRAEAANSEPLEVFLETLARDLDERKPPLDPAALRAASWQDISTKGAEVFIKFVKEPKMTTQVCLNIESHDQEPDFPWIVVENNKLAGGAVPIFLALELWPAWFPFCQKVEKLANLGTNQGMYLLRYKIAFLTVDIVLLAALVDNLSSNGRLELLFASPPRGAKSWMGTVVPGRTASFRYVIPGMRLSIRPSTTRSGNIVLQAETLDEVQIQWAVKLFWQACASRIIGLLSRMQRRYEGSTLQAHYAVETKDVQDQRQHFFKLEERIAQSCAQ